MALVPSAAELDDQVFIIAGAAVPYLLRKKEEAYMLIGECYVSGAMFGEAVDRVDIADMETFTLI